MPEQARKICEIVNAVVCSTAPLADDLARAGFSARLAGEADLQLGNNQAGA
jgi:hypothetical protein